MRPTYLKRSKVHQSQRPKSLVIAGAFVIARRRPITVARHLGTASVDCCFAVGCTAEVAAIELSLLCQRDSVGEPRKLHLSSFKLMVWHQRKQQRNQLRRRH